MKMRYICLLSILLIFMTGMAMAIPENKITKTDMGVNPVFKQLPGHYGGYVSGIYSPETGTLIFTVADDFQLSRSAEIVGIKWWGSSGPSTDNFTIMLFDDNGGEPGNLLYRLDGIVPEKKQTGWLDRRGRDGGGSIPEFEFNFNLPTSFVAGANIRYWLSIVNVYADAWLWEVSSPGDLGVVQRSFSSSLNGPWTWEPFYDNMAFLLDKASNKV